MPLVWIWIAGAILPACNKSTHSGIDTAHSTITTLLKTSGSSTYFYYAMTRTGFDAVLNSNLGPFTVFVPTDQAFGNSGLSKASLEASSDSSLKSMLSYLIADKQLLSSSIKATDQETIESDNQSVYLTYNSNGFFINGIPIARADLVASNGVIQFITSSVPQQPKTDLFHQIHSDTTLTYLTTALNRASTNVSGFGRPNDFLANVGPITFFAPTNQAFRANGYADTSAINAANPDSLALTMLYHFLPAILFSTDVPGEQRSVTYLSSDSVQFNLSGASLQVIGNHNTVPANVLKANTMATNGVLFTIDQVLKP
ncbi:MAG: hypothetical protein C5B59_10645 [Bacteroidetes bacterium]|nr:MAG: hypothetical protein C5B59_10645 [Bacteroidota bacterium]